MKHAEVKVALILAGGLGTRLREAVPDLPKPMAPVGGRPFLAHQMDYWIAQGIRRFVLSVGYRREAIINYFGGSYRECAIEYVVEETPLGTGGGLLLAMDMLPKEVPSVVLNGDTFFEVNLSEMLRFHVDRASNWTIALFRTNDSTRYMGVRLGSDGAIASFNTAIRSSGLANGGVYLIDPLALARSDQRPGQTSSLEKDLMSAVLAGGGRFFGYESAGRFIDIGVPHDYYRASEVIVARG